MRRLRRDDRGGAATENAAMLGLVIIIVVAAVSALRGNVTRTTKSVSQSLRAGTGTVFISYAKPASGN